MNAPVATQYSYEFARRHFPEGTTRVLEIGCGQGELASCLAADGIEVLAIDSDADCVAAAAARSGVEARVGSWPMSLKKRFDAILFTRSLHHIDPLGDAIDSAVKVLRAGGRIIVEDFRSEFDSPRTRLWFEGLVRLLATAKLFRETDAAQILEELNVGDHHRELHSSPVMKQALRAHGQVQEGDAAYYFRYVEDRLNEVVASQLLNYELSLIEAGAIDPLGKRFVLTPTP